MKLGKESYPVMKSPLGCFCNLAWSLKIGSESRLIRAYMSLTDTVLDLQAGIASTPSLRHENNLRAR